MSWSKCDVHQLEQHRPCVLSSLSHQIVPVEFPPRVILCQGCVFVQVRLRNESKPSALLLDVSLSLGLWCGIFNEA